MINRVARWRTCGVERNDLKNKRFMTQRSGTVVVSGNNNQRPQPAAVGRLAVTHKGLS